jgi:hypothetical protein
MQFSSIRALVKICIPLLLFLTLTGCGGGTSGGGTVATVRNLKFKPATSHGLPVPARISVQFEFHMY